MEKKIGFWHWILLSLIKLFLWLFGNGKKYAKGNIAQRSIVIAVIYLLCSCIVVPLFFTFENILFYFAIPAIPYLMISFGGIIYWSYLESIRLELR